MPSFREHLKRSTQRTGEPHIELNKSLDGDHITPFQKLRRHIPTQRRSGYVLERWGEKGLTEYRNHLLDDIKLFRTVTSALRENLAKLGTAVLRGGDSRR